MNLHKIVRRISRLITISFMFPFLISRNIGFNLNPKANRQSIGLWWMPKELIPQYNLPVRHTYFSNVINSEYFRKMAESKGQVISIELYDVDTALIEYTQRGIRVNAGYRPINKQLSNGSGLRKVNEIWPKRLENIFLAIQRNSSNYHHFLCEILPSLYILHQTNALAPDRKIVLTKTNFAYTLVRQLSIPNQIVEIPPTGLIYARKTIIPKLIPAGHYNIQTIRAISKTIVSGLLCEEGPDVVFIDRNPELDKRLLVNSDEIFTIIREYWPSALRIYPSDNEALDTVKSVSNARIIIAPHGANCTNMIWSSNLKLFVEISPSSVITEYCVLARSLGVEYASLRSSLFEFSKSRNVHDADHILDRNLFISFLNRIGSFR